MNILNNLTDLRNFFLAETMNDVTKKKARFNWHVAYSLHNNPQLRAKRKHFLDQLKAKIEETYERMENERKALKEQQKTSKQNGIYI